jgi:nuclear pore complex protein Nup205
LNDESTAVNGDFVRQTIFLSQQFGCSEKYIASILHDVMAQNPNINPVICLELTVAKFHERRRHLVDCLRFLLEAGEAAEGPDMPSTYTRIARFVESELLPGSRALTGEVTLASKMLKEVELLDTDIAKADAARKNAGSNTVIPTGQGQ